MTENQSSAADAEQNSSGGRQAREQSTIGFPYGDLDDAISVADALLERGGVPCDPDQLAGAMRQAPSSGNFRMKVATARMFGLIETVQGRYNLTDLGFAIADPARQKAAKAEAFLQVPLYRKVYEEFRNKQLPPRPVALERLFVNYGVAQKQAGRARQAFDRSAQQAGFFDTGGRERLIRPLEGSAQGGVADPPSPNGAALPPKPDPQYGARGSGGDGGGYHPFITGLLETLPAPNTVWSVEGRAAWLEAAASVFNLLYRGDGRISVHVTHTGGERKRETTDMKSAGDGTSPADHKPFE